MINEKKGEDLDGIIWSIGIVFVDKFNVFCTVERVSAQGFLLK